MIAIRLHHSLHDAMVRDVQSKLIVHEMLGGQGAAHLRDQSPEQHQQIVIRLTDDLEMVASRRAIPKFEGVESYSRSEQVGAKVKLVDLPRAIGETHRFELRMFESLQTRCLGHHIVEALAAEASVSSFNRAVVDDLVARGGLAATRRRSRPFGTRRFAGRRLDTFASTISDQRTLLGSAPAGLPTSGSRSCSGRAMRRYFKKYSQMKLQMKREALAKLNRQANESGQGFGTVKGQSEPGFGTVLAQ